MNARSGAPWFSALTDAGKVAGRLGRERRGGVQQIGEVVGRRRAGAAAWRAARWSAWPRPAAAPGRRGTARGSSTPASRRRRACRDRRASRAGPRTSCWRGAASAGGSRAPRRGSGSQSAIAPRLVFVFATRSVSVGPRSPSVRDDLRGVLDERLQRRLVGRQPLDDAARSPRATARSTWRPRCPGRPCPAYQSPKPWMTSCRPLARRRVERVEELVEVDDRRRLVDRDDRVVLQLGIAVRRPARARRSGWRRRTATSRGSPRSCPACSGAYGSSTTIVISAWLSSVSSIFLTEPIRRPPICTSLSLTSWPAVWNVSRYVCSPLPPSSTNASSATASASSADGDRPGGGHAAPPCAGSTSWMS